MVLENDLLAGDAFELALQTLREGVRKRRRARDRGAHDTGALVGEALQLARDGLERGEAAAAREETDRVPAERGEPEAVGDLRSTVARRPSSVTRGFASITRRSFDAAYASAILRMSEVSAERFEPSTPSSKMACA